MKLAMLMPTDDAVPSMKAIVEKSKLQAVSNMI